jgi:hypothetical protein
MVTPNLKPATHLIWAPWDTTMRLDRLRTAGRHP